jgi:acyl carrier protein
MTASSAIVERHNLLLLGPYVEPRSSTERLVAEIWRRTFGMDRVGNTDSFEDLGGDSLMAASIFEELEKSFGIKMPWSLLVDARTVQQVAVAIDALKRQTE